LSENLGARPFFRLDAYQYVKIIRHQTPYRSIRDRVDVLAVFAQKEIVIPVFEKEIFKAIRMVENRVIGIGLKHHTPNLKSN